MKMVLKINTRLLQRYKSPHKITPNPELSAFLKKNSNC
ncbi:hypothetical protein LEP1GSC125_1901 [Leptospira mayottensis 200901122]|uniref:Uncharacterized protein n=1 Tax=Leptospira mayottensis 200901122 TaxID=1193010 RepID=A0AA87SVX7_9LEPT|nr:hypothetical protein LEP1GSC125_1901 [Leptospira mayottensis 200901122]